MQERGGDAEARFFVIFRERGSDFSLRSRPIKPLNFFGVRRKVVLRGEGNAWASVSRSFDKIREVWVVSYLLYLLFKCFVDGSVRLRPVSGRLIGPKS